jgi:hypothetical protein
MIRGEVGMMLSSFAVLTAAMRDAAISNVFVLLSSGAAKA